MRRKYQRDNKKSEFMGTYPRPHFCQPSTTPNTPLGKSKSVTWSHWECIRKSLKRFFYSKAAVASLSHAWWDFICQKRKKSVCCWVLVRYNQEKLMVDLWISVLFSWSHTFRWAKQKVQHALPSGSLQRDDVERLTTALSQILVSCLAR